MMPAVVDFDREQAHALKKCKDDVVVSDTAPKLLGVLTLMPNRVAYKRVNPMAEPVFHDSAAPLNVE